MIDRRLILRDVDGRLLADRVMVLTGLDHADTRAPITAEVQQQCDMQHWHTLNSWTIPAWGTAARRQG